ncbi:hypothetical protein M3557_07505 [Bhargavaea ginsengi]|uniref:hypothetical protein n=1 Tax=Bhargavaea ginsengi TaxID=426757 RepID=UPI00203A9948|nr:hypothetical protein [Bhargavaea ginsengi]MCM3087759.1 hypothetical protein [Bhargavaea ginsengi]
MEKRQETQWRMKQRKKQLDMLGNFTMVDGRAYDAQGRDITDRIVVNTVDTPKQVRRLEARDELTRHETENGGFYMLYFAQARTMVERFPTLLQADGARLLFLATYASWEEGRLQYDNGVVIEKKDMPELMQMSRSSFLKMFKRFVDEGILEERDGVIYVNQSVAYRGYAENHPFDMRGYESTRVFKTTIRHLYGEYHRKAKQLGLLYSVIPFIHANSGIIAENPEETDPARLIPMSLTRLAMVLEYGDPHKLKQAMRQIEYGEDEVVFRFIEDIEDTRERQIIVNPKVIYGGGGTGLDELQSLFIRRKKRKRK